MRYGDMQSACLDAFRTIPAKDALPVLLADLKSEDPRAGSLPQTFCPPC